MLQQIQFSLLLLLSFLNTEKRVGKKANVCVGKKANVCVGTIAVLPSCRTAAKEKGKKKKSTSLSFPQVSDLGFSHIGKNPAIEGGYCKDSWLGCL